MNCLCCGKPLKGQVILSGWHPDCIHQFFGTKDLPEIELTNETLTALAEKSVQRGHTVPGVQKKLSLHLSTEVFPRLTMVDYPTGYILKPQVTEFRALPEAEYLVMQMAAIAGLSVVPHALIQLIDGLAYLTRRVDRPQIDGRIQMLAMEDFCQLDLRLTQDKYRGSYERCVKVIQRYSSKPGLDLTELFLRLVFCYLTGNSDMHLKNFSLIETEQGSGAYILSPAYDLLPVNVIMPEDQEEFALTMNGKKQHLRRNDFLIFAETAGIPRKAAMTMIERMVERLPKWIGLCEESLLPEDMKVALIALMQARAEKLQAIKQA
ncbi:MAG: HipA domain-containing protein [Clostridia bacterium]|nr:HipA domain-containing protein [Clostridia bacterium]